MKSVIFLSIFSLLSVAHASGEKTTFKCTQENAAYTGRATNFVAINNLGDLSKISYQDAFDNRASKKGSITVPTKKLTFLSAQHLERLNGVITLTNSASTSNTVAMQVQFSASESEGFKIQFATTDYSFGLLLTNCVVVK